MTVDFLPGTVTLQRITCPVAAALRDYAGDVREQVALRIPIKRLMPCVGQIRSRGHRAE